MKSVPAVAVTVRPNAVRFCPCRAKKKKRKKESLGQIYVCSALRRVGNKTYCNAGQGIAYAGFICVGFSIGFRIVDCGQGTAMTRIRGHDIPGNVQERRKQSRMRRMGRVFDERRLKEEERAIAEEWREAHQSKDRRQPAES